MDPFKAWRGAKNAYLDTFSFQALEFYKRYGYRVFGELEDFPPTHQRNYLTKDFRSRDHTVFSYQ